MKKYTLSRQHVRDCTPLRQEYNSTPEISELLCTECTLVTDCLLSEYVLRPSEAPRISILCSELIKFLLFSTTQYNKIIVLFEL